MPESRVQLRIEVETEGAEELTTLRRELDRLGAAGAESVGQLDTSFAALLDKLSLSRTLVADSTRNFLDSQRRLFAGLAPLFDSFFRSVFTGSRSLRDALKRLWRDFFDFFLDLVRRMVTAWLAGQQQMQQTVGASGLLGGVLGLPGLGGLGPGGTAVGGAGGNQAGIFQQLGISLRGLGPIPGDVLAAGGLTLATGGILAGFRRGSPLLGALTGAGGGAMFGFSVGGPIGAAIGAIVGGLAGLFGGIFGRGKLKRRASRIADEGFAEMRRVVLEFEQFRLDFESALAQVTQLWSQMVDAWSRLGGVGRRSIRGQQPQFEAVLRRIREIQQTRVQRQQLVAAMAIPEFQLGGMVSRTFGTIHAQQGRILAFLHQGEAVLNRRAVAALGEGTVERLNREPGNLPAQAGVNRGDQFFITINAVDGESVERWLAQNEARLVRFLRRAARDRGMPSPF